MTELEYIEDEIFYYTKLIESDSSRLKYNDNEQFQKDMSRCIEINKEKVATLNSIKQKLLANNIIFEKKVDVRYFKTCLEKNKVKRNEDIYRDYNCYQTDKHKLSLKEIEILKEMK